MDVEEVPVSQAPVLKAQGELIDHLVITLSEYTNYDLHEY